MRRASLTVLALVLCGPVSAVAVEETKQAGKEQKQAGAVDERARALLQKMSQSLQRLDAWRVNTSHETEVVLESGQKLQLGAESKIAVERPNHVRSDRTGQLLDATLYYDGRNIAVHKRGSEFYAMAPAPNNIDEAVDYLRDRLNMEVPAADLFYQDVYAGLMQNVTSGRYVGEATVRGVRCHHLAFTEDEVDWQIWIEDSPRALPMKYVITSKTVAQAPEFSVELYDWQPAEDLPDNLFTFVPPKGAERVKLLGAKTEATPEKAKDGAQ